MLAYNQNQINSMLGSAWQRINSQPGYAAPTVAAAPAAATRTGSTGGQGQDLVALINSLQNPNYMNDFTNWAY